MSDYEKFSELNLLCGAFLPPSFSAFSRDFHIFSCLAVGPAENTLCFSAAGTVS